MEKIAFINGLRGLAITGTVLHHSFFGMVAARFFASGEHKSLLRPWSAPVAVVLILAAMWLWGGWHRGELPVWSAALSGSADGRAEGLVDRPPSAG